MKFSARFVAIVLLVASCTAAPEVGPVDEFSTTSAHTPTTTGTPPTMTERPTAGSPFPDISGETLVGCESGPYFPASALEEVVPLDDAQMAEMETAMLSFLNNEEGQFWPQDGWQLLHLTESEALLVHVDPGSDPEGYATSFMSLKVSDGVWTWNGAQSGGPCHLQIKAPEGLNRVRWRLDPAASTPGPNSTEIGLLLTEVECVSGQEIGDRLIDPEIVSTKGSVLISFAATPPPGDSQTCPGNPETPFTLHLEEPLGTRDLVDARDLGMTLDRFVSEPSP